MTKARKQATVKCKNCESTNGLQIQWTGIHYAYVNDEDGTIVAQYEGESIPQDDYKLVCTLCEYSEPIKPTEFTIIGMGIE